MPVNLNQCRGIVGTFNKCKIGYCNSSNVYYYKGLRIYSSFIFCSVNLTCVAYSFSLTVCLTLREKCPNTEFFLVCIFRHSDWIRRDTVYLRIHTECEKIGTRKKVRIGTLFSHCNEFILNLTESFELAAATWIRSYILE